MQLEEIEHYRKFPAMRPFVGNSYHDDSHKKLLIVGESNYFPDDSTIHKDPNTWYESTQESLSEEEIKYCHCRNLLNSSWKPAGHYIYRELNSSMSTLPLSYNERPIEHASFMNAFQRPAASSGASFKKCCTQLDIEIATETIMSVLEVLKPELIVFSSKYSWDTLGKRLNNRYDGDFYFVCHPATGGRYWHNKSYKHGKRKFLSILTNKFIRGNTSY